MILIAALALPSLLWDGGPETADQVRRAGFQEVVLPAAIAPQWRDVTGISVRAADAVKPTEVRVPTVQYRMAEAGATRSPWIDANGWRFIREPERDYAYKAPGPAAALAAAEAHAYGVNAFIQTDAAGLEPLGRMLEFLRALKPAPSTPVTDIAVVDDGSPESGELMNLLARRNLLFRAVNKPVSSAMIVQIGTAKYPKAAAANPSELAQQIRFELTDERRALRIYGSQVVIGRVTGDDHSRRLHLLNYAFPSRRVNGVRIRLLGRFPQASLQVAGSPNAKLVDFEVLKDATEFTIAEIDSAAIVDLTR